MAQNVIVGLIVAVAVLYVVWRYMPQRWRKGLGRVHPKLTQAPGCGSGGDGGGCSSCGSCASAGGSQGAAPQATEKPVAMPQSRH